MAHLQMNVQTWIGSAMERTSASAATAVHRSTGSSLLHRTKTSPRMGHADRSRAAAYSTMSFLADRLKVAKLRCSLSSSSRFDAEISATITPKLNTSTADVYSLARRIYNKHKHTHTHMHTRCASTQGQGKRNTFAEQHARPGSAIATVTATTTPVTIPPVLGKTVCPLSSSLCHGQL